MCGVNDPEARGGMGTCSSTSAAASEHHQTPPNLTNCSNDFELAIRTSKELEHMLEDGYQAQGRGLHERVTEAEHALAPHLVRRMRYVATIRNKLIHERGFDKIPDRRTFIENYDQSVKMLQEAMVHGRTGNTRQAPHHGNHPQHQHHQQHKQHQRQQHQQHKQRRRRGKGGGGKGCVVS